MDGDMITLKAGPIQVLYHNGFLRYLRYKSQEVLRMIYFALRDKDWNTIPFSIQNEAIDIQENQFRIAYSCLHNKDGQTTYSWEVRITGNENGEIVFDLEGKAHVDVWKNRAGFCVLHPINNTPGEQVTIHHSEGAVTRHTFPRYIDPSNPFKDIRAMEWSLGKHSFKISFEGDVFETEDQRNWTDASFKTFCTPSNLPFPALLPKGHINRQKITFVPTIHSGHTSQSPSPNGITFKRTGKEFVLPDIGVMMNNEVRQLPSTLSDLPLGHLVIQIDTHHPGWKNDLRERTELLKHTNLQINLCLIVSSDYEVVLDALVQLKASLPTRWHHLLLATYDPVTPPQLMSLLPSYRQRLGVSIGAGTLYNFTEVNRNRLDVRPLDFVFYGVHPQEHAFDDLSLIENLEAQGVTVSSLYHMYENRPHAHICPVLLKKRFNPYATDPSKKMIAGQQQTDSRQKTSFTSVWTLGSVKSLAEAHTTRITYFELTGDKGIMDVNGKPYPVYYALQTVLAHKHEKMHGIESNRSLVAEGILMGNTLLAWNYTEERQTVHFEGRQFDLDPRSFLRIDTVS